jgi:hypothetical protein
MRVCLPDQSDMRTFAREMVENLRGREAKTKREKIWKYLVPKSEVLAIYCELPPDVLSIVERLSKNGWSFKKTTTMEEPNQEQISSYVELAWIKGSIRRGACSRHGLEEEALRLSGRQAQGVGLNELLLRHFTESWRRSTPGIFV